VKPIDSVAVAIDFPEIMLDKGVYFGAKDSEPKPLRMWLGDQFFIKDVGSVISRPTPMKWSNLEKDRSKAPKFSLAANHIFYKMAIASKIISPGETFVPDRIDELLGKAFQFQAQIFLREDEKTGKEYLTEKIKFVGGLGRGQVAPDGATEPFMVMFDSENDESVIKQLRAHVINTIKNAVNYDGSAIQKQLGDSPSNAPEKSEKKEVQEQPEKPNVVQKPKSKSKSEPEPFLDDSDSPF
ncbi:MAG: hypothetical protein ACRDBG_04435, partial [Waterburya sp.]